MVQATQDRRAARSNAGARLRLPGLIGRPSKRPGPSTPRRFDCPDSGTDIAERITMFHDCDEGLFACSTGTRPHLRITAYQFSGSYISLAIRLRKADLRQMRPGSVLVWDLDAVATRPLTTFLRLNLRTPEKTETLHETLLLDQDRRQVSFLLDGARVQFSQLEAAWLDLILSDPAMSEVDINTMDIRIEGEGGG